MSWILKSILSLFILFADADGILTTYDETRGSGPLKEDCMQQAIFTNPRKTPLFSGLKKRPVTSDMFSWLEDSYAAASFNKMIEGDAYDFDTLTKAARVTNYTQIMEKAGKVSKTEIVCGNFLGASQLQYQMQKSLAALGEDVEKSLLCGSLAAGASGTARAMAGVLAFITTNSTSVASGTKLTESFFKGLLELIWNARGEPDEVYTCFKLKQVINTWNSGATKNIAVSDKRLGAVADVYVSDIGTLKLFSHHNMPSTTNSNAGIAIIKNDNFRVAVLREIAEDVAQRKNYAGDAEAFVFVGELSLFSLAQAQAAKAMGFDTSYVM